MTPFPPPATEFRHLFHMQMSCAVVNNATSGSGTVLSVAILEMVKYLLNAQNDRLWRIIIVHLATLRGRSTNDSSLYSLSSRKKVERKGHTLSKTCKDVITSLFKTQRNTNIRRGKIPDDFQIPAGRIF